MTHEHPCQSCGAPVACGGAWDHNPDGWPECVCRVFHLPGGALNPDCLCEHCAARAEAQRQKASAV